MACLQVVCDVDEAVAIKVKQRFGFQAHYTDFREAVDRPDVDAVVVATPPGRHRDVTVAAAKRGKHVFCEKPISVDMSHADEMISVCAEVNVMLMVGYLFRYAENRDTLRCLVREGTIGRPVLWRESLPLYAENQGWLGDYTLGGGALFEYSHSIDFACYTFGRPRSVAAQVFRFSQDPRWQTHDSFTCLIKFESGDAFQLSGFGMLPLGRDLQKAFSGSHRTEQNDIVGNQGAIYFGGDFQGNTSMVVAEHVGSDRQKITTYPWVGWGGFRDNTIRAMLKEFFGGIGAGNLITRCSGPEARQTLAVIQACLESAHAGKTIELA